NTATLVHVTLTGNRADGDGSGDGTGGGLKTVAASVTLINTLVAGNFRGTGAARDDLSGGVEGASFGNLVGAGNGMSGISDGGKGKLVGTSVNPIDPKLGPLQNNGGPAPTHALLPGSPAINAASAGRALPADQRGVNRGAAPDIGALEFVPRPLVVSLVTVKQ